MPYNQSKPFHFTRTFHCIFCTIKAKKSIILIIYRYLFFFFKFPNPKQTIPDPGKSFGSNRFRIHETGNIYSGIVTFLSDELVDVLVVGVRQHDVGQSGLACISTQINNIEMFKSKVPNIPNSLIYMATGIQSLYCEPCCGSGSA